MVQGRRAAKGSQWPTQPARLEAIWGTTWIYSGRKHGFQSTSITLMRFFTDWFLSPSSVWMFISSHLCFLDYFCTFGVLGFHFSLLERVWLNVHSETYLSPYQIIFMFPLPSYSSDEGFALIVIFIYPVIWQGWEQGHLCGVLSKLCWQCCFWPSLLRSCEMS